MLKSFAGGAEHIVLATGATDFRKQITSLSAMVTMQYHMDRLQRDMFSYSVTVEEMPLRYSDMTRTDLCLPQKSYWME